MSKCNMNKFKPGGRCGGDSETRVKEDTQGVATSFASLLAARDAQDSSWATPGLQKAFSQPQQAIVFKNTINDGGALPRHRYDDVNLSLYDTSACAYNKHTAVLAKKPVQDKQKIMDFILQGDTEDF